MLPRVHHLADEYLVNDDNVNVKDEKTSASQFTNVAIVAEENKWRPFWQRGQTTIEEMNELVKVKKKRRSKGAARTSGSDKTKLYHSSIDLSSAGRIRRNVNISKSISTQGLNNMPDIQSTSRYGKENTARVLRVNSNLNVPNIEANIEICRDVKSREISAVTSVSRSSQPNRSFIVRKLYMELVSDNVEEDIYLSDDDPVVSRKNLDKAGDYIVEHDWILKENLAKEARKVSRLHKKIQIVIPDEDPLATIKLRMKEISMMVKPQAELETYLETIDPKQKETIVKYKYVHVSEIRRKKRQDWTALNRFQEAVCKVFLLYRACHSRKKYLHEDKPDTAPDDVKKIKQKNREKSLLKKSSLSFDMQLSLSTQCEFRTREDIKKVTQILRATKAFKNIFPAQLDEQLARVVAYERYDSRRIVAQQGRSPERFYFVLTGKLRKVREYQLLSGVVTREEGYIDKGCTTDPQELSHNWPREYNLVSRSFVEVLTIDKKDFLDLLPTCKGPPIDFLQELDLFREFPCEEFQNKPDAIDFRYYGQDKLIVKDSNRTPWLHIVKTGHVRVVRMQSVIDVNNDDKFSGQSTEELGCVRPFSHASAMLGILAKQRRMKTILGTMSLPELLRKPRQLGVKTANALSLKEKSLHPGTENMRTTFNTFSKPEMKQETKDTKFSNRLSHITEDNEVEGLNKKQGFEDIVPVPKPYSTVASRKAGNMENRYVVDNAVFLPPINVTNGEDRRSNDFIPHATYLTRERTEYDQIHKKKMPKEVTQRETFLQIDVLKAGDIFGMEGVWELFRSMYPIKNLQDGLEHMEPQALASEAPGVFLISDGAEIIKVSKRFFLQHAKHNTMLRVETMQREYMTPEEAKTVMYDKETWNQYKSILLKRTIDNLHKNTVQKVL